MAERDWWLRTLLVLQRPRAVFAALHSDDESDLEAREEPILALIFLAGIAGVLSTDLASRILDDFAIDGVALAVWAFVAGGIYGVAAYFALGFLLYAGARAAGSSLSYRRARHVLAFACVPLAFSLIAWPERLAVCDDWSTRLTGRDGSRNAPSSSSGIAYVCWSSGKRPVRTSSAYDSSARRISVPRSA